MSWLYLLLNKYIMFKRKWYFSSQLQQQLTDENMFTELSKHFRKKIPSTQTNRDCPGRARARRSSKAAAACQRAGLVGGNNTNYKSFQIKTTFLE